MATRPTGGVKSQWRQIAQQTFARREKAMPNSGYVWRVAALFAVINAAVGPALRGVRCAAFGGAGAMIQAFSSLSLVTWVAIFTVTFLVSGTASRFFFGVGAKNELKVQEKLAAKKQP